MPTDQSQCAKGENLDDSGLRIYCQNIYGFPNVLLAKKRLLYFLEKSIDLDYDIILLQEVFMYSWLEFAIDTITNIEDKYYICFSKKDGGLQIRGGLLTLIKKSICKKDKGPDSEFNKFSKQSRLLKPSQYVHRISNKGCLHTRIFTTGQDQEIEIINTHTSAMFSKNIMNKIKRNSVLFSQLDEIVSKITAKNKLFVLGGDFNFNLYSIYSKPNNKHKGFRKFLQDTNMVEKVENIQKANLSNLVVVPGPFDVSLPKEKNLVDFIVTNTKSIYPFFRYNVINIEDMTYEQKKLNIIGLNKKQYPSSDHLGVELILSKDSKD